MKNSKTVLIDKNPGRNSQSFGIARELGTDINLIHEPSIGVVGNKGDSQCYMGVAKKVNVIQEALLDRVGVGPGKLSLRLIQPEFTVATSDGIRNGTAEMRYSLIGREVTNDALCEHLSASGLEGVIAVVACDKPPVGTLAAILEHNRPAIVMSDGSIRPGVDTVTGEAIDIVSSYQIAGSDDEELKRRIALEACPGYGSCGGMFTYNTMQSFIGVVGMQPLHMISPASDDPRRTNQFPIELVDYLSNVTDTNITETTDMINTLINNTIDIGKAQGINSLSYDINFIKDGVDIDLDNLTLSLNTYNERLDAIRKYLHDQISSYEKKNTTTDYVKLHETEKKGLTICATKKRCETLKSCLAVNAKTNENIILLAGTSWEFTLNILSISFKSTVSKTENNIVSPLITECLEKIWSLRQQIKDRVGMLYINFLSSLQDISPSLNELVKYITMIDVSFTRANIAHKYNYCKPSIVENENAFLDIKGKAMSVGMNDYLSKPFKPSDLKRS